MALSRYKFSYTPQYSDLLYLGTFLIGGGTISLLNYPWFIPLLWLVVVFGIYYFIKQKPDIFFYEDFIELSKGFEKSKSITVINYFDVQNVEYIFSEVGRGSIFRITFFIRGVPHSIQYSFMGNPTKHEITFFENKRININVTPQSAKYKLYPSVK